MGFSFKWYGDELIKKINEKYGEITDKDLFVPSFMKRFTKFSSFEEFVFKSRLINPDKENKIEAFKKIPKEDLDKYVRENTTNFTSWEDMLKKAFKEYVDKNKI